MPGPRILTLQSCRWLDRAGDDEDALLKDDEEEVSFQVEPVVQECTASRQTCEERALPGDWVGGAQFDL